MRLMGMVGVVLGLGCGGVQSDSDGGTGGQADASADAASADGAPQRDGAPRDDSAPPDGGTILPPTCAEPPLCGEAGDIASRDDIVAISDACALWGESDSDGPRLRTPTFTATEAISVCPDDFSLPADCSQGGPLCGGTILVSVDPQLIGVEVVAACEGAELTAGARFRVRFNIEPPTDNNQFRTAHVHFERPCDAACIAGERRCDANDACYTDDTVCFDCGFGTRADCACRTPDNGALPDCTDCEFMDTDVILLGKCLDATCDLDPCAFCDCT